MTDPSLIVDNWTAVHFLFGYAFRNALGPHAWVLPSIGLGAATWEILENSPLWSPSLVDEPLNALVDIIAVLAGALLARHGGAIRANA